MTPPHPAGIQCAACRFYRAIDTLHGTCHRFPPSFGGETTPKELHRWRFPLVGPHAWCGEFQAEETPPA